MPPYRCTTIMTQTSELFNYNIYDDQLKVTMDYINVMHNVNLIESKKNEMCYLYTHCTHTNIWCETHACEMGSTIICTHPSCAHTHCEYVCPTIIFWYHMHESHTNVNVCTMCAHTMCIQISLLSCGPSGKIVRI
jgi:hypothetical protein